MRLCTDCDTMFAHSSQANRCRPCWNTYQREWRRKKDRLKLPHNTDTHKQCPRCERVLARDGFGPTKSDGNTQPYCRSCTAEYQRSNYKGERRTKEQIAVKWQKRMGLDQEEYDALLERQGGGCAICGGQNPGGRRLSIDHDHACCGRNKACLRCVRGLLCTNCNTGIGKLKDDPVLLLRAADYLTLPSLVGVD